MVLRLLIYYLIQLLSSINGGKEGFNTFVCQRVLSAMHLYKAVCSVCTRPLYCHIRPFTIRLNGNKKQVIKEFSQHHKGIWLNSLTFLLLNFSVYYSKAPILSISTSFSVRKRQSPRVRFFLVSPANCTRSRRTTR